MSVLKIEEIIQQKAPEFFDRYPGPIRKLILFFLRKILVLSKLDDLLIRHEDKIGVDFIDAVFDDLNCSYMVSARDMQKIPAEGKLIVVSNHPLGGLDAFALISALSDVRKDVRIVANDVLLAVPPIRELCLPFDVFSSKPQLEAVMNIQRALMNDEVVIFFPAAEVSRANIIRGIYDRKWKRGAVQMAQKLQAPILPVFIKARNSSMFYIISLLHRRLSTLLLPRQIFHQRNRNITLVVGDPIPPTVFRKGVIDLNAQSKLLRKHTYRIGHHKRGIFRTEKTIIHPTNQRILKDDLMRSRLLYHSTDGKAVYLVEMPIGRHVLREIARLRELTFRKVGEGTGNRYDRDIYDNYYKHIVLWDEKEMEIIGSYRIGFCGEIIAEKGLNAIYNASLFNFSPEFAAIMQQSIELGRSFIQYRYWRSNALDLLWKGIGALLSERSDIRYLFGAVSISDAYSHDAKNLLVRYYKKWYPGVEGQVVSKKRFLLSRHQEEVADQILAGTDYKEDYQNLRMGLKSLGFTVPILYKQYSELCEYGGVQFLDFGIDPSFGMCIDGLVLLDLSRLDPRSRGRYFTEESSPNETSQ
jgi:putative hemolysin